MNFILKGHGYSLTELDSMIPFEREIYASLLENKLKEEEKEMRRINGG